MMAKCAKCGRRGLFLKVNSYGLCAECEISELRQRLAEATRSAPKPKEEPEHRPVITVSVTSTREEPDPDDPFVQFRNEVDLPIMERRHNMNMYIYTEDKIAAHKSFIEFFDSKKAECEAKGGKMEQMFHERYDKFSARDAVERDLDYLLTLAVTKEEETAFYSAIDGLGPRIIELVRENEGALQRDLGKQFELKVREAYRNSLYQMESDRVIRREKSGSSYKLYLIDDGAAYTSNIVSPTGELKPLPKYCRICKQYYPVYENDVCLVCHHIAEGEYT